VNPLTICDTGHNEGGVKLVLEQISRTPHEKLHFVFGMVNDKEIDTILQMMPKDATYYFCKADIPRGLDANELRIKAEVFGLNGETFNSVKSALKTAQQRAGAKDLVFVGGSTFIVAEVV
jgi:dihydrofolate synthase/folylpolyglutamate synthase